MNSLPDEGFLLFGGPLGGSERGRLRVLLIVDAKGEAEIHRRLAHDPWVPTGQLVTVNVEPWEPLVGTERLSKAA